METWSIETWEEAVSSAIGLLMSIWSVNCEPSGSLWNDVQSQIGILDYKISITNELVEGS